MRPRELVQRRDQLINDIGRELYKIHEMLPQLLDAIKKWPTIAKGPIDVEAYLKLEQEFNQLASSSFMIQANITESMNLNEQVKEVIAKAYE